MKKIIFALLVVFVVACNPDEATTIDTVTPADLAGDWTCKEKSFLNGSSTFTVKIFTDGSNSNGVLIDNLYHVGYAQEVSATLQNGVINLPEQQFCDNQFSVWGKGVVSANKKTIDWVYYVNTGADIDSVSAQFLR